MPFSPELANRILSGASRASLRGEGFKFSNKLFNQLRTQSYTFARNLSDNVLAVNKYGLKSNRLVPKSMMLDAPAAFEQNPIGRLPYKYMYRANIVIETPYGEYSVMGRYGGYRNQPGSMIRDRMRAIGEQQINTANRQGYLMEGRVKRIEILTTLVNSSA